MPVIQLPDLYFLESPIKKKLSQREALRRASKKVINQEMQYEQRE
jgi:hypothetical protein